MSQSPSLSRARTKAASCAQWTYTRSPACTASSGLSPPLRCWRTSTSLAVVSPDEALHGRADHHRGDHLPGDALASSGAPGRSCTRSGRTAIIVPSLSMKFVSPMKSATNGLDGLS